MTKIISTLIILLALLSSCVNTSQENLLLLNPKVNGHQEPVGIDAAILHFSWQLEEGKQQSYHIKVSTSRTNAKKGIADVWDSKKTNSEESFGITMPQKTLDSFTKYWWQVKVWNDDGASSSWTPIQTFTTGAFQASDWQAHWISNETWNQQLPIFRKVFNITKEIKSATIFTTGLGHYELFLNNNKVGNHFMAPAWSAYDERIFYNAFDVTEELKSSNCFAVMLGNGFYRVPTNNDRYKKINTNFGKVKFVLQMKVEYTDGSTETLCTDNTWKMRNSPITFSSVYGGEDYNASAIDSQWKSVNFDDKQWKYAKIVKAPTAQMSKQISEPMEKMELRSPKTIKKVNEKTWVYDFGQNASAIPLIKVKGQRGQKIKIFYGEQLNADGSVNQDAITHYNASNGRPSYFSYTLSGEDEEIWVPQFSYSGFQYLEISGATPPGEAHNATMPQIISLSSVHVRNSAESIGTFECSNETYNKIYHINDWAVRSNFSHVLTDCPHREKLGWLEVSHLMAPSIMYNYDASSFYDKIMCDISDIQANDGMVPTTAPDYNRDQFSWNFIYAPEWGSAAVINPWHSYTWYGDEDILKRYYPTMQKWVNYLDKQTKEGLVQGTLGDWCDWEVGRGAEGASKYTSNTFVASAIQYYNYTIMIQVSSILEKKKDTKVYQNLAIQLKDKINSTYYHREKGYYDKNSQTANAMALYLSLVPEDGKERVLEHLVNDLRSRRNSDFNKDHMQTSGDIGHRFLLRALAENGRSDVIDEMTMRTGLGSYGRIVNQGLTSMPETWNISPSASFNHCMLSHIMEWFHCDLVGINPDPSAPGFKQSIIRPYFSSNVEWVKGSHQTPYGLLSVYWKWNKNNIILEVNVPANSTAQIVLPSGSSISCKDANTKQSSNTSFTITSGSHSYVIHNTK